MITKEVFQNKLEKLVTKSDLEKVVDRVKREITTEMTEKFDFVLPGHKSNNYGSTFFVGIRSKSVSNVYITFFGIHVQFVIKKMKI
jgi:hypothetical protein